MNYIQWNYEDDLLAGTTLRDPSLPENNNMALHACLRKEDVLNNRDTLSKALHIASSQWTFAMQTHSDHIHEVTAADAGRGYRVYEEGIADCDALYTKERNIAIGVFHADCVPVLLYDPFTGIIAAIHSGWQGTVQEITRKTVTLLMQKEHVDPAHLMAYIGPAIAYRSFEIQQDVIDRIRAMSFDTHYYLTMLPNGRAIADNKGLNMQMLLNLGVERDHITVNPNDTFLKNDAFFSYRREPACGRHLSFILRK